jgi:hypothetical protein
MSAPGIAPLCDYLCVGVCMDDPDSGYCLGCGRPPLPTSTQNREALADPIPRQPATCATAAELTRKRAADTGSRNA